MTFPSVSVNDILKVMSAIGDQETAYLHNLSRLETGFEPAPIREIIYPTGDIPNHRSPTFSDTSRYYQRYSPDYLAPNSTAFKLLNRQLPSELASPVNQDGYYTTSVAGRGYYVGAPEGKWYLVKGALARPTKQNTTTTLRFPDSFTSDFLPGIHGVSDVMEDDMTTRELLAFDPRFRGRSLVVAATLESVLVHMDEATLGNPEIRKAYHINSDTERDKGYVDIAVDDLVTNRMIQEKDWPAESVWEMRSAHRLDEIPKMENLEMLETWVAAMSAERVYDDSEVFSATARYWNQMGNTSQVALAYLSHIAYCVGLNTGIMGMADVVHDSPSLNQITWAGETVDFERPSVALYDGQNAFVFRTMMQELANRFQPVLGESVVQLLKEQFNLGYAAADDRTISDTRSLTFITGE